MTIQQTAREAEKGSLRMTLEPKVSAFPASDWRGLAVVEQGGAQPREWGAVHVVDWSGVPASGDAFSRANDSIRATRCGRVNLELKACKWRAVPTSS